MRWWEQQIGSETRGRVISLLRRGARTVEELAAALGVTDNAVRPHLQVLEHGGVVRVAGTRPGPGAGKPAVVYEISQAAESSLSGAYAPVLAALLASLAERIPEAELTEVMRDTGRRLAPLTSAEALDTTLEERVHSAAVMLRSLGAEVDVEPTPTGWQLRGFACPLSAAVRAEPHTCQSVEELLRRVVDGSVRECCDKTGTVRCRFEFTSPAA